MVFKDHVAAILVCKTSVKRKLGTTCQTVGHIHRCCCKDNMSERVARASDAGTDMPCGTYLILPGKHQWSTDAQLRQS